MLSTEAVITLPLFIDAERPRERCLDKGPGALSLRECLAVILGSGPPGVGALGLGRRILDRPGPGLAPEDQERAFFTAMESPGGASLTDIDGLGPAGRARLLCAFEIGRRYACYRQATPIQHATVPTGPTLLPPLASRVLTKVSPAHRGDAREWLGFVPVYRSGEIGGLSIVEQGVRTHVNVDPAEFFARVLALRPRGFVLLHNHPSGNLCPSIEDHHLTDTLKALANQLGMSLYGHWIVAPVGEYWMQ